MTWKPSNEPTRPDRVRVAQTDTMDMEINKLRLPPLRRRKLHAIMNALTVQIEDGGDSPEVNHLLLEALRAAVCHQVGEERAKSALRAMDAYQQAEAQRWEMVQSGTLPPIELTPQERLDDLMQEGYRLLEAGQRTAACDKWLETWEQVKEMATSEMRTTGAFDDAYPGMMQCVFNWCGDLEMELGNAGLDAPTYHEHRLRYVREFLVQFSDEDVNSYVNFCRAEGEALWQLGKQAEAEAIYQSLVEKFPEQGWAYIGWSDEYYFWSRREKDYASGEAILLRALEQPNLEDREDVLERLMGLYREWGQPEKQTRLLAKLDQSRDTRKRHQL